MGGGILIGEAQRLVVIYNRRKHPQCDDGKCDERMHAHYPRDQFRMAAPGAHTMQ